MINKEEETQNSKILSPPSHITLCQELIARNAQALANVEATMTERDRDRNLRSLQSSDSTLSINQHSTQSFSLSNSKFIVHEDEQTCTNWKNPHQSLMNIIASSIVSFVGVRFGLEYYHDCHHTVLFNNHGGGSDEDSSFDVTTIQQIFPSLSMPINEHVLALGEVVHNLCSSCIHEYQTSLEQNENDSSSSSSSSSLYSTHHCLLFPYIPDAHLDYVREQAVDTDGQEQLQMVSQQELLDSQGHIIHTALEAALPYINNRLSHAALDWAYKSVIPERDPSGGAVVYLDAMSSLPIPFHLYQQYLPQDAVHVSILSGPECAIATFPTTSTTTSNSESKSIPCLQYGLELQEYLQTFYSTKKVNVSFDLISSTAAAYSRMILTKTLLCPPGTTTCLLPALAKDKTKDAIILESPDASSPTYKWFTELGGKASSFNNIKVIPLTSEQMIGVDSQQSQVEDNFRGFAVSEVIRPDIVVEGGVNAYNSNQNSNVQSQVSNSAFLNEDEGFTLNNGNSAGANRVSGTVPSSNNQIPPSFDVEGVSSVSSSNLSGGQSLQVAGLPSDMFVEGGTAPEGQSLQVEGGTIPQEGQSLQVEGGTTPEGQSLQVEGGSPSESRFFVSGNPNVNNPDQGEYSQMQTMPQPQNDIDGDDEPVNVDIDLSDYEINLDSSHLFND
jgi:hypothetical protein